MIHVSEFTTFNVLIESISQNLWCKLNSNFEKLNKFSLILFCEIDFFIIV